MVLTLSKKTSVSDYGFNYFKKFKTIVFNYDFNDMEKMYSVGHYIKA